MKKIIGSFILLISLSTTIAASTNAGAFLENGIGARASGLGMSYVALANDSSAIFWNPAGLGQIKKLEISSSFYRAWETDYMTYTAAFPFFAGINLGLGFHNANMGNILQTIANPSAAGRYIGNGSFSYSGNAVLVSAGVPLSPSLSIGATYKYLFENLYVNRSSGMSVDVGMLWEPFQGFKIGVNAQDIWNTGMTWNTESNNNDKIPYRIRSGCAWSLFNNTLNLTTDVTYLQRTKESLFVRSGIEYWIIPDVVAIRVGLMPIKPNESNLFLPNDTSRWLQSAGIGLKLNALTLDASWTNQPDDLDIEAIEDVFRFSIGYQFDNAEPETTIHTATETEAQTDVVATETATPNIQPIKQPDVCLVSTLNARAKQPSDIQTPENGFSVTLKAPDSLQNDRTEFSYEIKDRTATANKEYNVDFHIKDVYGNTVKDLVVERKFTPGVYMVMWDGQDKNGVNVPKGTYYLRLFVTSDKEVATAFSKIMVE